METRCLICESTLVITKAQAQAFSLLLGTLGGFLGGFSQTREQSNEHRNRYTDESFQAGLVRLTSAVENATAECAQSWEFAQDVQRYHFGEFDCLCLRCGARFDQQLSAPFTPQPSDPPIARPSQGSAGDPQVQP
ncbi:hypothetical protein D9M68_887720 [compost metagenome]